MFGEIPSAAPTPSWRSAVATFAIMFATCLCVAPIAWIRWSRPLSLLRKAEAAEFVLCGVLSGVFLLSAKAASPETNRKRVSILFFAFLIPQLIIDVIR
jgi:hypothetical protein